MKALISSQWHHFAIKGKESRLSLNVRERLTPIADPYVSLVPSRFLYGLDTLAELERSDEWIVRDGCVPLYLFFKRHPKPHRLRARLYIDPTLRFLVPEAWITHVGIYQVEAEPRLTSKLLITGLLGAETFSEDFQKIFFGHIGPKLRKKLNQYDEIFLATRVCEREESPGYATRTLQRLFSLVGDSAQVIGFAQRSQTLKGYDFLELNDGNWCVDTSLRFLALSSAARGLFVDTWEAKKPRKVPLSPYHSLILVPAIDSLSSPPSAYERALVKYRMGIAQALSASLDR